jgi:hypothetical protein
MSLGGPGGDTASVVAALRAVTGVADAEILPDPSGGPGTLRLQLAPGADEVLVATTVHRVLGDRFGLGVDAGRVQVVEEAVTRRGEAPGGRPAEPMDAPGDAEGDVPLAPPRVPPSHLTVAPAPEGTEGAPAGEAEAEADQLAEEGPAAVAEPAASTRLLIHRMQLVSARDGVTSEVTLELSGAEHTGSAAAATTTTSVHRSVALATLRAVERALDGRVRFELEHLESAALGSDRAVVVEVSMITKVGSERLTGVSAVREDARQAVIRATLDALNRRIDPYLLPA